MQVSRRREGRPRIRQNRAPSACSVLASTRVKAVACDDLELASALDGTSSGLCRPRVAGSPLERPPAAATLRCRYRRKAVMVPGSGRRRPDPSDAQGCCLCIAGVLDPEAEPRNRRLARLWSRWSYVPLAVARRQGAADSWVGCVGRTTAASGCSCRSRTVSGRTCGCNIPEGRAGPSHSRRGCRRCECR